MENGKPRLGAVLKTFLGLAVTIAGLYTAGYDVFNNNSVSFHFGSLFPGQAEQPALVASNGNSNGSAQPANPPDTSGSSTSSKPIESRLVPVTGQAQPQGVAIVTTETGQPVYDACFVLVGSSNEGCDQNQDGKITFEGIVPGTYTLQQTRDLGPGRSIPDSTIQVTGDADNDGWERIHVSVSAVEESRLSIEPDSASMRLTLRGCPEGFDPGSGNFHDSCAIPLDAPDASRISGNGNNQVPVYITSLYREFSGTYVFDATSPTLTVEINGLAPVLRDGYRVFGNDGASGETYTVNLSDGETRDVFVFYYYD